MDYYQPVRDKLIKDAMYPVDHRTDFFPPKGSDNNLKLPVKAPCKPTFVTRIEGNAVEEGARVYFEGIVDSQPQPKFTWYFNDEPILPGYDDFQEAEIHDSRKMSTLIVRYAREHHMGKYTLIAENKLGYDISNCDLIVRKKQFPPVFWKRLYDRQETGGSRLAIEVEVGGWPIPEVFWYKDDELVISRTHTENYNGFPNRYVPERRIEVRQIDQIRYCILFHKICESDSGFYACRALNPLGEAVCEGTIEVVPGIGGEGDDMYLPELWKTGKRLTWKDEDMRKKKFVGYKEPELTDDDIADMMKKCASTPLPRAMEYLAGLPDYKPTPLKGLIPMDFKGEIPRGMPTQTGKRGGTVAKPSKFKPGAITHSGYVCDDGGRILPKWKNPLDPYQPDPNTLKYSLVRPEYPEPKKRPPREKSPPAPPVWETQEQIDALYKFLDSVGLHIHISDIRKDKVGNADQQRRQQPQPDKSNVQQHHDARKTVMQQAQPTRQSNAKKFWEEKLNQDISGAQENAEDFTKAFVQMMTSGKQMEDAHFQQQRMKQQHVQQQSMQQQQQETVQSNVQAIVTSPVEESSSSSFETSERKEHIPIKEKIQMIAQQQEAIAIREEQMRQAESSSGRKSVETVKGGVRVLPSSPSTVRKNGTEMITQEEHKSVKFADDFYGTSADDDFRPESNASQITESSLFSQEYTYAASSQVTTTTMNQSSAMSYDSSTYSERTYASASTNANKEFDFVSQNNSNLPQLDAKYDVQPSLDDLPIEMQIVELYDNNSGAANVASSSAAKTSSSSFVTEAANGSASAAVRRTPSAGKVTYEECRRSFEEAELEAMATVEAQSQASSSYQQTNGLSTDRSRFLSNKSTPFSPMSSAQSTPILPRKNLRQPHQLPAEDEEDNPKYRTPPQSPFQPGFYRQPADTREKHINPKYKLPSQIVKTSTEKKMLQDERSNHVTEAAAVTSVEMRSPNVNVNRRKIDSYDGDCESDSNQV